MPQVRFTVDSGQGDPRRAVCLLSYRRLMVMPLPTMALYFMSDMEIIFG